MATDASEEIIALHQEVASISKQIGVAQAGREAALRSSLFIETAIAQAKDALQHHTNNIKHMRKVADVVNLKEYKQVVKHAQAMAAALEAGQIDLAETQSRVAAADRFITDALASQKKKKERLEEYGRLLVFPNHGEKKGE